MKIIFSPTKTQRFTNDYFYSYEETIPHFQEEANIFFKKLHSYSEIELKKLYKVSDKIASEMHDAYQSSEKQTGQALFTYTGITFQSLGLDQWDDNDFLSANERLYILDALYGVLRPSDVIGKYRLDMSHNKILEASTLKKFWEPKLTEFFESEELIVNLSSDEFASNITSDNLVHFSFLDKKDGEYKAINTYVKMARGKFTSAIVREQVKSIEEIKLLSVDGYQYSDFDEATKTFIFKRDNGK